MISKPKILITLTDLRIVNNTVNFSVTDGQATLNGVNSKELHLENDFLAVVKELIQGNPTYQKGYVNFTQGDWPERSVRFAIDSELVGVMINTYRENAEGAEIVKLNEYFINLFDKVNGNTAVSRSVGIANLVKSIQADEVDLIELDNPIVQLMNILFKRDAWDHNNQGANVIEGKLTEDGEDIEFNTVSAVGNVYVEGKIGKMGIRIFKSQNVQVYIGWDTNYPKCPEVFQVYEEEKLTQRLYDAVEISLNSPA